MHQYFTGDRSFSSLSIKDLLEAQEAYHVHLAHLRHVVATAIGRFRIRDSDPDFHRPQGDVPSERAQMSARASFKPRTLSNTDVRDWSWPCLLVFVNHWMTSDEMRETPTQVVPRFMYMPDGRVVPTCVIYAEEPTVAATKGPISNYPDGLLGGGCPTVSRVQERDHTGTVACLVSDGNLTYALTNRHVAGPKGRPVSAIAAGGNQFPIGHSAGADAGKLQFSDVYPGWPGDRILVNIDAGLVVMDSLQGWTTQAYGLGELDEPVNLNTETLSLDIIGCPLKAYGGASGKMEGRIQAIFYRYRSIGGVDYIADLLIGPRYNAEPLPTRPGDSGTLWVFDDDAAKQDEEPPDKERQAPTGAAASKGKRGHAKSHDKSGNGDVRTPRSRPVAIQWGGHVLVGDDGKMQFPYGLATCISTVCRALDVEVVRDWNIGHSEYWGELGHYKIAAVAIDNVRNNQLKTFLRANLSNITFDDETMRLGKYHSPHGTRNFPLADVPDLVWKAFGSKRKPLEHPNHFADMDQKNDKGIDLLHLADDPKNVDSRVWHEFYNRIGVPDGEQGLLPFRVWQLYDAMVKALQAKDAKNFLISAGTLAHYVGDSCQPLHISENFDGRTDSEKGVHSAYETKMLDRNKAEVIGKLNDALGDATRPTTPILSGHDAAVGVVRVMQNTFRHLSPDKVIDSYVSNGGDSRGMWHDLGDDTVQCLVSGCLTLAAIWDAAWRAGGDLPSLDEQDPDELSEIYHRISCLPSMLLSQMVEKNMCTLSSGDPS
jgi:hypothetical protein